MTVGRQQKENFYLKDDFTSYLQSKDLAPSTIRQYLFNIALFLAWIDREETQITKPDVLKYLEYLKNKLKIQNATRSKHLICLNYYFTFLYKQEQISQNPCAFIKIRGTKKKSLYRIYTSEELTELYDNFYSFFVRAYDDSHIPQNKLKQSRLSKERNAVIVNILVHQGVTTKEIDTLELCDLDLTAATLKIHGARRSNGRTLGLEATQIGVLMHYLQHTRPQLLEYNGNVPNEKLFFTLSENSKHKTDNTNRMYLFELLTKQLKEIDKHFLSCRQIRASVITNWLKVHGLRKTQVMAGHRYISSTEKYQANDLQQLTDDINKLHPF